MEFHAKNRRGKTMCIEVDETDTVTVNYRDRKRNHLEQEKEPNFSVLVPPGKTMKMVVNEAAKLGKFEVNVAEKEEDVAAGVGQASGIHLVLNGIEKKNEEKKCNWDNLPNELKVMCIEKTDFKTRANLMLSNRHNKMLVESVKHHLSYVNFFVFYSRRKNEEIFQLVVKSWRSTADYKSEQYEPRKFMDLISNAKIDILDVTVYGCRPDAFNKNFINDLQKCDRKFSVKSLHIGWSQWDFAHFPILEHCDEQLEQITLYSTENDSNNRVKRFLRTSQVIAAKRFTISDTFWPDDSETSEIEIRRKLERKIRMLLFFLKEQKVGKEIIYKNEWDQLWEVFCEFAENKIDFRHPTEKMIRLRLQNPAKRVWVCFFGELQILYFSVVPAGSDAPNIEEIEKKYVEEKEEYQLKTSRRALF